MANKEKQSLSARVICDYETTSKGASGDSMWGEKQTSLRV